MRGFGFRVFGSAPKGFRLRVAIGELLVVRTPGNARQHRYGVLPQGAIEGCELNRLRVSGLGLDRFTKSSYSVLFCAAALKEGPCILINSYTARSLSISLDVCFPGRSYTLLSLLSALSGVKTAVICTEVLRVMDKSCIEHNEEHAVLQQEHCIKRVRLGEWRLAPKRGLRFVARPPEVGESAERVESCL